MSHSPIPPDAEARLRMLEDIVSEKKSEQSKQANN